MKLLMVSLFVCTAAALTTAAAFPETDDEHWKDRVTTGTTTAKTTVDPLGGWRPFCPQGWTMFNTHCVLFVPRNMTWAEAETNCRLNGGNLASVYNSEQASEIRKEMQRAGHDHRHIWVGGYNTVEDPSWVWSDHLFRIFHHWCRELTTEHKHHCLQITFREHDSGCLEDRQCDARLPSACGLIIM